MVFRNSNDSDINSIMKIISQAQMYFKEQGINQWQDNYPNAQTIRNDIARQWGFVIVKDNQIIGTVAVSFDGEPNYDTIYEGKWISIQKYAVIHRIAVDENCKGQDIASNIIHSIEEICLSKGIHSIKVDTHEDNKSMHRLLVKNRFQYCGIIFLENKSKRVAFEKIL